MNEDIRSISEVVEELINGLSGEIVVLGAVLESLHERGIGFVLLILALPVAIITPVPPGVNILFALPLLFLTMQQFLGARTIWLPLSIKRKTIKRESLAGMLRKTLPLLNKMELLTKPRLGFMTQRVFSRVIGLAGFIMALSICVPLPLTNTIPGFGIAIMALGVLMRDGLAVMFGMALGLVWVFVLFGLIIYFGVEGVEILKDFIKGLI